MFSIVLPGVDDTSVVLCTWDSCYSCWLLILSSGVINRTLSHICDRLHLTRFLLRVTLKTLI